MPRSAHLRILSVGVFLLPTLYGCRQGETDLADDASGNEQTGDDDDDDEGALGGKRVVLHRLNRSEYNLTVRDLFGADLQIADDFPSDDPSLGFDNIAQALTLSPLQFELYERAADAILERVLAIPSADPELFHVEAESINQTTGGACCNGSWNLWANGEVYTSMPIENAGTFKFRTSLFGQQAGADLPHAVLKVDDQIAGEFDVSAVEGGAQMLEVEVRLNTGDHRIAVEFTNDFYDPDNGLDRNLVVDWLELYGPLDGVADETNPLRERLVTCDPEADGERACLEEVLRKFLPRALRRPIGDESIDSYLGALDVAQSEGEGFEAALFLALKRALLAPEFLFRVEYDDVEDLERADPLDDYELASRLSYFLWSSMPDDELFALAAQGKLSEDAVLAAQVERMLDDAKARALVDNFGGQWLSIRALNNVFKDPVTFADFDAELQQAMKEERERFVASFLREDRPLAELLTADATWANARLAEFYGISGGDGETFEEVSLATTARRGLLGQAGLMAVLGHPESTAPVLRGKWILEHLLCMTPPPPPGDIDIPPVEPGGTMTMREKLAQHRADPACASCHNLMDPLGLALENYDGIGAFRLQEAGQDIDVSGNMPDGTAFVGPQALAELLAQSPMLAECAAQKAMIYGLGRNLGAADMATKEEIAADVHNNGLGLRSLLRRIAMSAPFRHR